MSAMEALQSDVSSRSCDHPFFAAAGMRLAKSDRISSLDIRFHVVLSLNTGTGEVWAMTVYFIPEQGCGQTSCFGEIRAT